MDVNLLIISCFELAVCMEVYYITIKDQAEPNLPVRTRKNGTRLKQGNIDSISKGLKRG